MVDINRQAIFDTKKQIPRLFGRYRAIVWDNVEYEEDDPAKSFFGRVKVFIPDFMENNPFEAKGDVRPDWSWAYPANNSIGGRNDSSKTDDYKADTYWGESNIPIKGSWVWVFFEAGNPNRCFYDGACDIMNSQLPPENQIGKNDDDKKLPKWYHRWIKHRSPAGRTIVISDYDYDERVEITGKKKKLGTDGIYEIDGNQSVILIDGRDGSGEGIPDTEKILIKDINGNYINIYTKDDELYIDFKKNIHIRSREGDIFMTSEKGDIHINAKKEVKITSGESLHLFSGKEIFETASGDIHHKADKHIYGDGATQRHQQGRAIKGTEADKAKEKPNRDE